jgi:hypothetical protein
VEVDRGLFLFRYAASAARSAPTVMVACEHGSERKVALLSPPGYPAGILARPGDALVVQAHQPARLSVQVRPSVPNGSVEADVSIERLGRFAGRDEDAQKLEKARNGLNRASVLGSNRTGVLELLAHVASVGDIHVPAGQWIAGPESPARIEGLAVTWPGRPLDVGLNYAVRVGGRTSTLMRANGDGSFVGTRGQARPLTEVRFELGGRAAKDHEFVVDALFNGATPVRAEGRSIFLSGPSGREALVGLRVGLVDASVAQAEVAAKRSDAGSGRVRVFRSSPEMQRW